MFKKKRERIMNSETNLIENDILDYLKQHEKKDMLRFLTCGSVDDGKSTLIGRLLHDSKMIFEDHLIAIQNDSKKCGTQGENIDLALLVDGLQSEREQGITIDVAYRYFSTEKRKFIIADTPGHEQYTRNMATGASNCELAIILVDARNGIKTQTRRHSFIVSLLGIKHIIVAINKMDLMDYRQEVFESIHDEYLAFSKQLNIPDIKFIPLSALNGDNVVNHSKNLAWYQGETLMDLLDTIKICDDQNLKDFRFPVQYVNRPNSDFRGFCGTVSGGSISKGDKIITMQSGKRSEIKSIVTFDKELDSATTGDAITLTLKDEIDISRGDMICKANNKPQLSDCIEATIIWMAEAAMIPHKQYDFKLSTKYCSGTMTDIKHQIDVNSLATKEATHLGLNEIGVCRVKFTQNIAFDNYNENRKTGGFIVIDRLTNNTIAAGMINQSVSTTTYKADPCNIQTFELELNALIRKHFPHWETKDISKKL